jgi:hypothetical protein
VNLEHTADWSRIASVALALVQLVIAGGMLYLRKEFVSSKDCDKKCHDHEDKRVALEQRQTVTELAQSTAPTGKEMAGINKQLGDMAGDIKALRVGADAQTEAMRRIERPLNLLLENEITGGK